MLVQQPANHASVELAVLHAMPLNSEPLQEVFVYASMDTMSFIMPINRELVENAVLNALHAQLLQLPAPLAIPQGIDSLELILQDVKLVFVNQDITPFLMAHVSNPTVMLILSVPNANKVLDFAFNAWPQETESLNTLKAFVFAWTDSMLTQPITVLPVLLDAYYALQPLTVQAVLSWPLPMEMEAAHAHQRHTLLYLHKELVTVLPVDLTAVFVLTLTLAQAASHPSPGQLITNVFAQQRTLSTEPANVSHAQLDANPAHHPLTAANASNPLSFKALFVKATAMTASLLLAQSVKDVPLDAFNALKTSSASTVLMDSTCTMEPATAFVLLEPSETAHQATGTVSLATLPV